MRGKRAKGDNPKAKNFINNNELLAEIIACKTNGNVISDKLARMLLLICERYSFHPNFRHYSNREDMVSDAILNLVRVWFKFDETRFSNPFSFYTTCVHRCFIQQIYSEKNQRNIRDELLIEKGFPPSWNYQSEEVKDKT